MHIVQKENEYYYFICQKFVRGIVIYNNKLIPIPKQ